MAELSSDELFLVNQIGDRFEIQWQRGGRPRIEDFLAAVEGPLRQVLLKHLIGIEVELLRRAGRLPRPEDYERRFSGDCRLVSAVFAEEQEAEGGGPEDRGPLLRSGEGRVSRGRPFPPARRPE